MVVGENVLAELVGSIGWQHQEARGGSSEFEGHFLEIFLRKLTELH